MRFPLTVASSFTIFYLLAFYSNSVTLILFPKPLISFIFIPSSSQSKCCLYRNLLGTLTAAHTCPSRNRKAALFLAYI